MLNVVKNIIGGKFCINCGGALEEIKAQEKNEIVEIGSTQIQEKEIVYKSNLKIVIALIVSFLLLIGTIVTIGIIEINKYKEEIDLKDRIISNKNDELYEYQIEDNTNKEKADFLDENIVFVLDGYGNYYYTYDQVQQVTQGKEYSYWAYNREAAISQGYKAWK